MFTKMFDDNKH